VWKFICPSKEHTFIWNLLNNKALTLDNLQKRNTNGVGRCPFCNECEETNYHLVLTLPFSIQDWKELVVLIGIIDALYGVSIECGLK
jgi:hypothetical protein